MTPPTIAPISVPWPSELGVEDDEALELADVDETVLVIEFDWVNDAEVDDDEEDEAEGDEDEEREEEDEDGETELEPVVVLLVELGLELDIEVLETEVLSEVVVSARPLNITSSTPTHKQKTDTHNTTESINIMGS
ncbi:hypothetical protein LENED_002066 [Lentinula edodes]|uniref:Uncharacterized protein n=1 Tax=Lentinula edodes TaxID=5353 RepID=A0A1Q3E0L0_LENED|nr:hypothetical protein LENED_002066 [Lentinula edodes]